MLRSWSRPEEVPREYRPVRDGALPVPPLARGRLRPLGERRAPDVDPGAVRTRRRRRGVPRVDDGLSALGGLTRHARGDRRLVPGRRGRARHRRERRLRGEPAHPVVPPEAQGSARVHDAELHAGLGPGPALRPRHRHLPAEAARRPLGTGSPRARPGGHLVHEGGHGLQPEQPDRPRADRARDGCDRGRRRPGGRLDRGRRDLSRRRARHRRDHAHVLGPLRQGRRHERPVEGVRDAGPARRVDRRAHRI